MTQEILIQSKCSNAGPYHEEILKLLLKIKVYVNCKIEYLKRNNMLPGTIYQLFLSNSPN